MTERTYFGPCRAGLHPEFGWGEPCQGDAAEYVSVRVDDRDFVADAVMRLCTNHANVVEQLPGFYSRRPLTVPYTPPVVRL